MDKLTIFPVSEPVSTEVTLTSNNNKSLDDLVNGLDAIVKQLEVTHLGHEIGLWGSEVNEEDI